MKMEHAAWLDRPTRWMHAGLVVFGLSSWLSGELAEATPGYWIHALSGLGLATTVLVRIAYGCLGPPGQRFSHWLPVTRSRWRVIAEDLRSILAFTLPVRPTHTGLAGLVEALGLLLFAAMGASGTILFLAAAPGVEPAGLAHAVAEVHEIGEALIPLYLALHVGAAVAHELAGHRLIRRMFG